jgi:carboxylesterase
MSDSTGAPAVMPGAEPWSYEGGPVGVLCLHGFTGNPNSMRGVALAFANAGYSVELPRLPGHGTSIDDMLDTTWHDWSAAAEDALQALMLRCEKVVVIGQSMGASLALWLGTMYSHIQGIVCINPATQAQPDNVLDMVRGMIDEGTTVMAGIGSDIADPDAKETAYDGTPLVPLLTMQEALKDLELRYGQVTCPLLVMTSVNDHVVDPANSDYLAEHAGGPVERVSLERSFHVATLDYDKELVHERALEFAKKVTA